VIPRPREVRPAEPPPRLRSQIVPAGWWASGALGVALFWVAYENGGSGLTARAVISITVWWMLIVAIGFGFLPRAHVGRATIVVGGLLAAFALDTFASVFWAPSAADAFNEFNRVALYLGLFVAVALFARRSELGRWADGLMLGLAAIAVVALVSRLFPGLFSDRGLPEFLPASQTRLSFPIGYWNGLGILMGMTLPLCLRGALTASTDLRRSLALLPVPILASVIYLTSSRGGFATALVGTIVFLAATNRRWEALGAILAAALGSTLAIAALVPRTELVNGPLGSDAAHSQGRLAALIIAGCCLVSAVTHALGTRALSARQQPSRLIGRIVLGAVLLGVVGAAIALDPVQRFEEFKRIPGSAASSSSSDDFVRAHLLSGNGSGRWQFWSAAIDEFQSAPAEGRGAASYQSWWAKHASFTYFLRNAHSLYLEALGELGLLGLVLIVAAFTAGVAIAVRRVARASPGERPTVAGLTAVFAAFAFAAAIDWVWQITVIAGVGLTALALVAASESERPRAVVAHRDGSQRALRVRFAAGSALLVASWVLICAQAIPWLASLKLADSQAAVRRGDGEAAFNAAADAKRIQPWASSPYLQLALVEESSGQLVAAHRWIERAIDRDEENWRLWLVAARLETKTGQIHDAARSLRRAASLNPRSPLFSDVGK
jgi:O-Antigen ligase